MRHARPHTLAYIHVLNISEVHHYSINLPKNLSEVSSEFEISLATHGSERAGERNVKHVNKYCSSG